MLVASLIVGVAQFLVVGLGDYYGANDCDMASLTIEYFDPDHKKGLTAASDEWIFMREALIAAYRKVPETYGIHRRSMGDYTSHSYNSLVLYSHDTGGHVRVPKDAFDKIARAIAEPGTAYCQVEENWGVTTSKDCNFILGDPRDGSPRASTRFLFKYGFMGMRTWEHESDWWIVLWGDSRDPYYRLAAMKKDPMYREVFGKYDLEVFVPRLLIGDGSSIEFESRPRTPEFTGAFTLRFSYGWGDCPDGCTGRHDWLVKCRPLGKQNGTWQFDVQLVREEGGALSDQDRACLRCGHAGWTWSH